MNMAQFANKVIGQPITNWDVSHNNNTYNVNKNDTYKNNININKLICRPVTDWDIIIGKISLKYCLLDIIIEKI